MAVFLKGCLAKWKDVTGKQWPLAYILCPSYCKSRHSKWQFCADAISNKMVSKQKKKWRNLTTPDSWTPPLIDCNKSQLECSQMLSFAYYFSPNQNALCSSVLQIGPGLHVPSQPSLLKESRTPALVLSPAFGSGSTINFVLGNPNYLSSLL